MNSYIIALPEKNILSLYLKKNNLLKVDVYNLRDYLKIS